MTVTASPAIRAPALPCRPPAGTPGQQPDAGKCTLDSSRQRQAGTPAGVGTCGPCAAQIRASSVHAHRSLAPIPVRYASVATATQRSTALQGDTPRDRDETPR